MDVTFKKTFLKDLERLPANIQSQIHAIVFVEVPHVKNLFELRSVKKLIGYTSYYRIRVGSYRIGFYSEGGKVVFMRVLDRKEMYKYFP